MVPSAGTYTLFLSPRFKCMQKKALFQMGEGMHIRTDTGEQR